LTDTLEKDIFLYSADNFPDPNMIGMRKATGLIIFFLLDFYITSAQSLPINRQLFFSNDSVIEATLTTDIKLLRHHKNKPVWQPASISMQYPGSSVISEQIGIMPRGIYRKENCDLAALMLDFKKNSTSKLSSLKKLKLVGGCQSGSSAEILLLKEYLVYKIYNFISPMGFRVRLLHVVYKDSQQKMKTYSQYAFLIEDIKDLADRNNCVEVKNKIVNTEATDRQQMNLVSLFQYMIGNTDWSVRGNHNIKLMASRNNIVAAPYPVPYDFDYAGLVNADYAVPAENLSIKFVTERLYRGYPRNMNELQLNLEIFRHKKEAIMAYIKNFTLLNEKEKKEMTRYLDDFYRIINDKKSCQSIFIDNARTD